MGLVLVTLVLAVLVGWVLGGRLRYLERLPYRSLSLLVGALAAMLGGTLLALAGLPARPTQGAGLALAAVLTLLFCVRSRAVPGLGLVSVGLLLNAVVILANAGMPVSRGAALRAGLDPAAAVADARHQPEDGQTRLRPLGDVIPVPLPVRPEVASLGDLLGAAGMAQLVVTAMLLGRPAPGPPARGPTTPAPYRRRRIAPPAAAAEVVGPAAADPTEVPPVKAGGPAVSQPSGVSPVTAGGPAAADGRRAGVPASATDVAGHVLVAERRGTMTVWRAVPVAYPANGRATDLEAEPAPRGGAT